MKMTKSFNVTITRLINEGIRIKNRKPDTLLDSKSEHHRPSVKRKVYENTFNCHKCAYKFKDKTGLKMNVKSKHESQEFECNKCDYNFKDPTSLKCM